MIKARVARRIAMAAAYGGGGLGALSAAAFGLVRAEAALARRTIGEPTGEPPDADGVYGAHHDGEPLTLALLGDSSAAGLGVDHPHQTPGAMLAAGLSECADRPVRLVNPAVVGARSSDLVQQVDAIEDCRPNAVVIMIGANDVTHRVKPPTAVRHLDHVVRRVRDLGAEVVVGTCPDLGTVEPVPQPLRYIARRSSRQLAAAQTIVVVEAGGRTVSLGDILGPEFAASPKEMFGPDRFHPSVAGYASAAAALLPSVCAALGVWFGGEVEKVPDLSRGEGVRPIALAAVEAADEPGTEVAGAQVGGRERGPRGRWALLRHRPGRSSREVQATAEEESPLR
ncbi:MAG TPA: SGNH/GDSL hydrolase family protein [Actinomycetes bacterium]|jgi:lysophospholipase L1-like esterase